MKAWKIRWQLIKNRSIPGTSRDWLFSSSTSTSWGLIVLSRIMWIATQEQVLAQHHSTARQVPKHSPQTHPSFMTSNSKGKCLVIMANCATAYARVLSVFEPSCWAWWVRAADTFVKASVRIHTNTHPHTHTCCGKGIVSDWGWRTPY